MKKVLIFSLVYYPDFVGGAELAIRKITDRDNSVSFDMVTLKGGKKESFERIGNVDVYRVGFKTNNSFCFKIQKILFPFLGFWKGVSLHKKNNYSTVWAMMANQAGFAAMFLKKKFPSLYFVLTLQEGDPISQIKKKVRFVYFWFKQIFTKADYVTAISEYLKDFGEEMGAQNAVVIPNGVDLSIFDQKFTEEEKQKTRQQLGVFEGSQVLITTSRLVVKNGLEFVISAMKNLPSSTFFLILGVGNLEQDLRKQVVDLKLKDRVKFLGIVEYSQIPRYFAIADVFVRPSLSEGLGNSFLEAMYFGLPTVGTNVGGIQDFLFDEETGFVCEPSDVESLTSAIKRAFDHGGLVVEKAQDLVRNKFDWNVISHNFQNIWK